MRLVSLVAALCHGVVAAPSFEAHGATLSLGFSSVFSGTGPGGLAPWLTATYTETFVEQVELGIKPDRTVMLRFELKHLGDFNYKTDVSSYLARGENTDNK